MPVAPTTRAVGRALAIGPRRSLLAPDSSLARIERTRPTASRAAAWPARRPHSATANVVRNGIAPYWQTAPTAPMTVGRPTHRLAPGSAATPARPSGGRGAPPTSPRTPRRRAPAAHQNATRQPLAAPRAPSSGGDRQPGGERHAVDAHGEPAPPGAGDAGTACSPAGKYSPAPAPSSTWAATTQRRNPSATAATTLPADVAASPASISGRAPKRPRTAPPTRLAAAIDSGQQTEGQPGLALGHAELGGDLRHHRGERLLADGDAEVGQADEGERAPAGPRRAERGRAARRHVASRILYAISCCTSTIDTVAELVDPVAAERAVDEPSPLGRGEAATTQRVRGVGATAAMASAMAAVVPPYCGGKLYATNAGRFTFLNVLFDIDGRLLATLDGDAVTACAPPPPRRWRSATSPHRTPRWPPSSAPGRQAWPHIDDAAARRSPARASCASAGGRRRPPTRSPAAPGRRASARSPRDDPATRSTVPRSSSR